MNVQLEMSGSHVDAPTTQSKLEDGDPQNGIAARGKQTIFRVHLKLKLNARAK